MALKQYHDAYQSLPPAYIADANGVPVHSWRVLLLPFLGYRDLYERYTFDEPWDSARNRLVTEHSVEIFSCPSDANGVERRTNYVAVVGGYTAWPAPNCVALARDLRQVQPILLVCEIAGSDIEWAEPRDLHVVQMLPLINAHESCGPSSKHRGGINVLLSRGRAYSSDDRANEPFVVEFIENNLGRDKLQEMITRQKRGDSNARATSDAESAARR
jgi:hypothetical protein